MTVSQPTHIYKIEAEAIKCPNFLHGFMDKSFWLECFLDGGEMMEPDGLRYRRKLKENVERICRNYCEFDVQEELRNGCCLAMTYPWITRGGRYETYTFAVAYT